MLNTAVSNLNNNLLLSNLEVKDREKSESDINEDINITALLNKIIENIKDFCNTCIQTKYIRIVKYKFMIPMVQKLEKFTLIFRVHINLYLFQEKAMLVCY